MTQDEIIEMAKQAGWKDMKDYDSEMNESFFIGKFTDLKAFANLVAQNEREACAQILANTDLSGLRDHPLQNWVAGMLFEFIKAIRARGQA